MNHTKSHLVKACASVLALAITAFAQNGNLRLSSSHKGSLLMYSKIELKWTADGRELLQDTIIDISNDYPEEVDVQAFFINGDPEVEEICVGFPCEQNIIQEAEPGWNTADCRFTLTANQPHFWSAARGSDKCQPFMVLDANGPGRPDPETGLTTRILRGYAIFFAVDFIEEAGDYGRWKEIRWNHLFGDAVVLDYQYGTAWEYNAWAFQSYSAEHGEPTGDAGLLSLDGVEFDAPYANLILDFYASGSTALSGGHQTVQVDTDLTVHAVSADLRQDNCGPLLTKIVADIWNENESKFSGTRRCVCCWDQTMLSEWVRTAAVPNHFLRSMLGTDKGKARLDALASIECDYEAFCGPTAVQRRRSCDGMDQIDPPLVAGLLDESEDTAVLGLAIKFLEFTPSGTRDTTALNIAGAGVEPAWIEYDVQEGPSELYGGPASATRGDVKIAPTRRSDAHRAGTVRNGAELPSE